MVLLDPGRAVVSAIAILRQLSGCLHMQEMLGGPAYCNRTCPFTSRGL